MGKAIGPYNAWLEKVQKGEDNAAKLLAEQLKTSGVGVSPAEAATMVMNAHLALLEANNGKHFTDLADKITANEEKLANSPQGAPMHAPGESSKELADKLKTLDLTKPEGQEEAAKIAKELLSRDPDPKFQQILTVCIRGQLWEDTAAATKATNPEAGPKEIAEAYNKNLAALAEAAGPELASKLKLDAPAVDPKIKTSIADTYIMLAEAAEKLDPNTAVKRLETKITELETASKLIEKDIQKLTMDISSEKDPAKKVALESRLEKLQDAKMDLIGRIFFTADIHCKLLNILLD